MLNQVTLVGNVGKVEFKDVGGGLLDLSVATTMRWKDKDGAAQEQTEWHNVSVWGNRAKGLSSFLAKGHKVLVQGRLQTDSFEKDGVKHYRTKIVADNVLSLTNKGDKPAGGNKAPSSHNENSFNVDDL